RNQSFVPRQCSQENASRFLRFRRSRDPSLTLRALRVTLRALKLRAPKLALGRRAGRLEAQGLPADQCRARFVDIFRPVAAVLLGGPSTCPAAGPCLKT